MDPSRPRPGSRLRTLIQRGLGGMFGRVLLSLITVSLAISVTLAVLLTDSASSSLSSQARAAKVTAAGTVQTFVTSWYTTHLQDARTVAGELAVRGASRAELSTLLRQYPDFTAAGVYARDGRLQYRTRPTLPDGLAGQTWFATATRGGTGTSPVLSSAGGAPSVRLSAPVSGGRAPAGTTLVVELPISTLTPVVAGAAEGRTGEAFIADADHRLLVDSAPAQHRLGTVVHSRAVSNALGGRRGSAIYRDYQGNQAVGGFAPVPGLRWAVVVKQDTSVAFAAVARQRTLALILILAGLLVTLAVAWLIARFLSEPLVDLQRATHAVGAGDLRRRVMPHGATEARELGESFNGMVDRLEELLGAIGAAGAEMTSSSAELSAAAEQLASATNQQSSGTTETSATMEELSRTSAAIAEHADGVAGRCRDTQQTLRDAEGEMRTSSERTMALARQVDEISSVLQLINSIADKTAVLSLNAAIEAARAGESGAGFSVVSEEVGRLAERSKASASQIAEIVRATQRDATATVMAMEAGGQQMRRGLELMDEVTTAASQVQLTTQQQRSATMQVVDTMASLAEATRQTSATTHQIAQSAANLSGMAEELLRNAASRREDPAPASPSGTLPPAGPGWREAAPPPREWETEAVLAGAGRSPGADPR